LILSHGQKLSTSEAEIIMRSKLKLKFN